MFVRINRLIVSSLLGLSFVTVTLLALLFGLNPGLNHAYIAHAAGGDIYCVTPGGGTFPDCDQVFTSVQAAVDATTGGEEIRVATGVYTGVTTRNSVTQVVYIDKSLTLRGGYTPTNWTVSDPETNPAILDAEEQGRVLYVTGDISVTVEGLHMINGRAVHGGGVFVLTATTTFSNNTISNNVVDRFGWGGGVIFAGTPKSTLVNNIIDNNQSPNGLGQGGGISFASSTNMTLIGNTIEDNRVHTGWGGGISFDNSTNATLIDNSIVSNVSAGVPCPPNCSHTGGLYCASSSNLTLTGNIITGNRGIDGGGLWFNSCQDINLTNNNISDNQAATGGGLKVTGGTNIMLQDNVIDNNGANRLGAGASFESSQAVTLMDNTITNNFDTLLEGINDFGAGLFFTDSSGVDLINNTVMNNGPITLGGGLYLRRTDAKLVNNVIIGNQVWSSADPDLKGSGSAIYISDATPLLLQSTIAGNSGGDGIGIAVVLTSTVEMTNTILVSHTTGISVEPGSTLSINSVLWHNNSQNYTGTGNINIVNEYTGDPAFAPDDYHLTAPSAARDKGVDAGVIDDIDGDARPAGYGFDLGADELAELYLQKTVSQLTAQPEQTLTYQLVLSATSDIETITLTDTLPVGVTYVPNSVTGGGVFSAGQIRYTGPVSADNDIVITYQATVNSNVQPGTVLQNAAIVTGSGYHLERTAAVAIPDDTEIDTLLLIYINGDNNLSPYVLDLINRAEKAMAATQAVVFLVLDGPGNDGAYLYKLQSDQDESCPNFNSPDCNGLYIFGETIWHWNEDGASPHNLAEFLKGAISAYPAANQIILSLVGHGGGWSPEVLGGQPSSWTGKPVDDPLGGLLWDENPGNALSTADLGKAIYWSKAATGRKIDLLYLDACLMAMVEVAAEIHDTVSYLLASENWSWTTFPYDEHLKAINGSRDARAIGEIWLQNETDVLYPADYPFTFSLADLSQITGLITATSNFAEVLIDQLPADRAKIEAAIGNTECFDSNQDGLIDNLDNYCDLGSLAQQLKLAFTGQENAEIAAQAVHDALSQVILVEEHNNGVARPHFTDLWEWEDLGGLSIYAPLAVDDWKRRYYTAQNLYFVQESGWDAFLAAYWDNQAPPDDPICLDDCELPPPPLPIIPPVILEAEAKSGLDSILIEWALVEPVNLLAGYHLDRRKDGGEFETITTSRLETNQYTDGDSLELGAEYCYQVRAVDQTERTIGLSNETCTTFGKLTLELPHQAAAPGAEKVLVPVKVKNGTGLCIGAIEISISYDPAVIMATGNIYTTSYTTGYLSATTTATPGQVKIVAISNQCQPLAGPGSLFLVEFEVLAGAGAVSPLDFITGEIFDHNNVMVELQTDNGSLNISATHILGDVTGDGTVKVDDALEALRIATHQIDPTPEQLTACDANGDSHCTAADATLILCYVVSGDWLTCLRQEPHQLVSRMPLSAATRLTIGTAGKVAGQTVSIPINIKDNPGIAGGDLTILYDADKMTFENALITGLTQNFAVESHVSPAGILRVSFANTETMEIDGTILNLFFQTENGLSPLTLAGFSLHNKAGQDFEIGLQQPPEPPILLQRRLYLPIISSHN